MRKIFFLPFVASLFCVSEASSQSVAKAYKPASNGNPISASVFCADPTAMEYDGRIYVYGSNDHQQFIANNKSGSNGYGAIKSLVVFSTSDLVNWTFHGTIDVGKLCSSWGWRFADSWAPSATWRKTDSGIDEFFVYFANGGGSVGVLKGTSPVGPFKSPLSKPMIEGSTAGVSPCNWVFDPGVVVDENGTGWIAFGGGDPNNQGSDLQPNNARIAKLKKSMTAIDGKAVKIPAPYHFEASELNIIGGKFVYTYCSSWRGRNDWSKYQKEQNMSIAAPGACTMCYMVSDDPLNPDSWEYRGDYGPHPGTSPNNHSHLQLFAGNYYHFYHSGALEKSMNTGASGFRSLCVNKATVNEATQKINKVTLNNTGAAAVGTLNPYELQQAETMATCGGISYENFSNITKVPTINALGNDASKNLQVKMAKGAWTLLRKVEFGDTGATAFTIRAKGTGTVELRVGTLTSQAVATMDFSSTTYDEFTVELDPSKFTGNRSLYIVFTEATNVYFDTWQFSNADMNAIRQPEVTEWPNATLFDLSGHRLPANTTYRGPVIEQYTAPDGKKQARKRLWK